MKRHIILILVLMSLCVTGIIGLQLFWNYQNYKTTVKNFDHDINEALEKAVAQETEQRRNEIVKRFKGWLADTSLITITADHNNRDSSTVFYTQDTHPKFAEDKTRKFQFGLSDFKEKLNHITPKAKAILIEHFGDRILKPNLKEGVVYHYTQMLGDSLEKVFVASKLKPEALQKLFGKALGAKGINADFVLNPAKNTGLYLTKPINTNFRKPFKNDFVFAGFESPNSYFFKEMKWVIVTSLLLILITIGCFSYTVKTLLSQQKLAELKDAFVNNMTHELNTPISSIKITAEALKSFNHQPETRTEYLDIISFQADRLTDLTSKILNNSKLVAAHETKFEPINLNKLVAQAIRDIKPQAARAHAQINEHLFETPLIILGEAFSLHNAIVNIIDNAIKYSGDKPIIDITTGMAGNWAILGIADNGIGIPQEYQQKVFEQFFRVPKGNLHDVKGYGLGLSYVNQVARQHKGQVFITENKPSGTIFTFKIPIDHE